MHGYYVPLLLPRCFFMGAGFDLGGLGALPPKNLKVGPVKFSRLRVSGFGPGFNISLAAGLRTSFSRPVQVDASTCTGGRVNLWGWTPVDLWGWTRRPVEVDVITRSLMIALAGKNQSHCATSDTGTRAVGADGRRHTPWRAPATDQHRRRTTVASQQECWGRVSCTRL
jgi:hypothetical protein